MFTAESARKKVAERGPRFAIVGSIRPGEDRCNYALTAEGAEATRREFEDRLGYYQVKIYPPEQYADAVGELGKLGAQRNEAHVKFIDVTDQVRALATRLVQDGALSEVDAARRAQVDRMTIRSWLGKR